MFGEYVWRIVRNMEDNKIIKVSEFSRYPTGRYKKHSNSSGEEFRDDYLLPALNEFNSVTIVLDDTEGYGSSFLDEAFAQIPKNSKISLLDLKSRVKFISENDPSLITEINDNINSLMK